MYMCGPPRIYPSLPEYTSLSANLYVRPSQNLPLPPRIYPPFQQIYMCDPPRIYPSLPEYTPLFTKYICATLPESTPPAQNIPLFSTTMLLCGAPGIYPSLSEYTPFQQLYGTLSETTPPSENAPPFFDNYMTPPPPSSQNIPLLPLYNYMRYSKNLPLSHWIYPLF